MAVSHLFGLVKGDTLKAFEKAMKHLPSRTLPLCAAYALNGTAFEARDRLRDEAKRVFDRPTDYAVRHAFFYEWAKLGAGSVSELRSRVFVKDRQSAFYKYQVNGGPRRPGDVGPGATWLFLPVAPELINPKTGGMKNSVLRGLSRRSGMVQREVTAGTKRRDSKKPGVFFAKLFGTTAIWERPTRTAALWRRKRGVRQVHNSGAPRLLVAAFKREQYQPRFDFQGISAGAFVVFHSTFAKKLGEEIDKLAAQGYARPRLPTR